MFTIVIVRLNGVMKRMTSDFQREIRSVNCQFFIFLFAYLTRSICIITFEFTDIVNDEVKYVVFLLAAGISQLLPTFTILLLHYKAFGPKVLKKEVFNYEKNDTEIQEDGNMLTQASIREYCNLT